MNTNLTDKIELAELANKLFMYTDAQKWQKLKSEVFTENVWFDMKSISGAEPQELGAAAICDMWQQGFKDLDAVHHQAGQYIITVEDDTADIYAYAIAIHYKKSATKGQTRSFTGSYDLKALKTEAGWRLNFFKYNLKIADGNVDFA